MLKQGYSFRELKKHLLRILLTYESYCHSTIKIGKTQRNI